MCVKILAESIHKRIDTVLLMTTIFLRTMANKKNEAAKNSKSFEKLQKVKSKVNSKSVYSSEKVASNKKAKSLLILSPKRTRSKSKKETCSLPTLSPKHTRSKSKKETHLLPILSPKRTRSKSGNKSEKSANIDLNSDFSECQKAKQKKKQPENLKISTIQYVRLGDFSVDSIVLAKQKYAVPWPSKVLKIEKERVLVFFFGDKRNGYVLKNEIYDFNLSIKAIKSQIASKNKPKSYLTGIAEVEMLLGLTSGISLLN